MTALEARTKADVVTRLQQRVKAYAEGEDVNVAEELKDARQWGLEAQFSQAFEEAREFRAAKAAQIVGRGSVIALELEAALVLREAEAKAGTLFLLRHNLRMRRRL